MTEQLALLGGAPVAPEPLIWRWPPGDYDSARVLAEYLSAGGPLSIQDRKGIIERCEAEFERCFERRHALLVSSGTMALYSAYFALDLQPGDELICPTVTYHATATPALHLGAHVVLVDVEPDTGNIDVEALERAITSRTRAVATNAMWGHPVEQCAVAEICRRHGLPWVEDCSHAHLATYEGRPVGSWGTIACASLQGQKLITGGEAGVLLTDDTALYDRAVLLGHPLARSSNVRDPAWRPLARTGFGLKLRCHPLAAALVHDQLAGHAARWVEEREHSLSRLSRALRELPGLRPPVIRPAVTSMGAWYGYKPWVDTELLGVSRDRLVQALRAEGLDCAVPGSPALHRLALFDPGRFRIGAFDKHDNRSSCFPGADRYQAGLLSLPTPTGVRDEALLESLIEGFQRVWRQIDELRG